MKQTKSILSVSALVLTLVAFGAGTAQAQLLGTSEDAAISTPVGSANANLGIGANLGGSSNTHVNTGVRANAGSRMNANTRARAYGHSNVYDESDARTDARIHTRSHVNSDRDTARPMSENDDDRIIPNVNDSAIALDSNVSGRATANDRNADVTGRLVGRAGYDVNN